MPANQAKFLDYAPIDAKLERASFVPTNMASQGLLSETSHAHVCYTQQVFAQKLQVFMINYVLSVTAYQSVYK